MLKFLTYFRNTIAFLRLYTKNRVGPDLREKCL